MLKNITFILLLFGLEISAFAQSKTQLIYKNNGFVVYKTKALYNNSVIYDAGKDLKELIKAEKETNCPINYNFYYHPLSLIGNYFSYEAGEEGVYACGVPGNSLAVKTIDVKTKKIIKLTDLFSEEEFVKAIKNNKWFVNYNNKFDADVDKLNLLSNVLQILNEYKFNETSFAISNYNSGLASVRFIGYQYLGFDHVSYFQIELLIKPKADKLKLFASPSNFYLNKFPNGIYKNLTTYN